MQLNDSLPRLPARAAGLSYLALAVMGMLGFLVVRPTLLVAGDGGATLANLVAHESLARAGIALEIGVVLTQAIAALSFYEVFRSVNTTAAGAIAAFGLVNSVVILSSACFLATALGVAIDPSLAPAGDAAATAMLMYGLSGHCWSIGGLFFGLWLMPMGYLVVASQRMPKALGWILMTGAVGYIVSPFTHYLAPASSLTKLLALPATVGELWMIGYLLWSGFGRRSTVGQTNPDADLAQASGAPS